MHTFLKIFGTSLVVLAALMVALIGLAASKGFFSAKGLILDLPTQGRVVPLSAGTVVATVLFILAFGIVLLVLGKRSAQRDTATSNQQQGIS